jgi:zinc/manganese transport system ATP-binding protein
MIDRALSAPLPVIEIRHATVAIRNAIIWQDISLDVMPGEFLAIIGPNGAGKSTLLKAILGLIPLATGNITVLRLPVRRGNAAIGYVPQRRHFDADVRVRGRDIVALGVNGNQWGLSLPFLGRDKAQENADRVQEVIVRVGAADLADRPIGELSGGQQQRLLIAQALVTRPKILILDEPLDSLDLSSQQEVAELIHNISHDSDTAVLLVAHDVNPIISYVDRVMCITPFGVKVGTPAQIIQSDVLSELYGATVEVFTARDGRLVVVGLGEEKVSHHAH